MTYVNDRYDTYDNHTAVYLATVSCFLCYPPPSIRVIVLVRRMVMSICKDKYNLLVDDVM